MSLARSTWTSRYCRPWSTGTSAAASKRVSSTSSLRRAFGPVMRDSLGSRTTGSPIGLRPARRSTTPARRSGCSSDASRSALRNSTCAEAREPPASSAPASPSSTNWKRRRAVIGSMSAPRSITAPWPAKMFLATLGATMARVTPSARLTAMVELSGLIAGATSIAALNGPLLADVSSEPSADRSTSLRPRREKPATIPGVTHLPRRVDDLGAARDRDVRCRRRRSRPSRMTTVPPGIGSDPSPSATVPPVMATVWAASGGGRGEQRSGERSGADHFTSPSPGWPSSKSLTGRRRGLALSYIRAPSIHTLSGRV